MGDIEFLEKADSRENEGNLEETEQNNNEENKEETVVTSTQQQHAPINLDLNLHPKESDFGFPEKQTENFTSSTSVVFGVDLKRMERYPDDKICSSSSKKMKFLVEEEGERTSLGFDFGLDRNVILCGMESLGINKGKGVSSSDSDSSVEAEKPNHSVIDMNLIECVVKEINRRDREIEERSRRLREIEERYKQYKSESFHETAQRFAKSHGLEFHSKNDTLKGVIIDDGDKEEFGLGINKGERVSGKGFRNKEKVKNRRDKFELDKKKNW